MDINQLNVSFRIQEKVSFETGSGGFPVIRVQNQNASALISVYGGQVLSFKPVDDHADLLFLSKKSSYEAGRAIRGGIPLCWPWFGPDPKGLHRPNHGFARNHFWTVIGTTTTPLETKISLQMTENNPYQKIWQPPFTLTLDILIAKTLTLKLVTKNTGDKPFSVTQAFHTYFNLGDIKQVQVLGLAGCRYFDMLDQGKEKIQTGIVTVSEEMFCIYENKKNDVVIVDPSHNRRIEIVSENCKTGVIWNPWQKAMVDLGEQDYQRFVCVETGNMAFDPVQVPQGGEATILTTYKIIRA